MIADPEGPIGVFDSGIGGLTVACEIKKLLPNERIIYFGDTAHLPYGDKSADAIRYYSLKISKFLIDRRCKTIVIACNSASSAAYEMLLDFFEGKVHFVNVVDPLVEAVIKNGYQRIGVIATKATINSGIYRNKIRSINQKAYVHQLATPLLVPMIEEGFFKAEISRVILKEYLKDPGFDGIEAMLLGCTHYPLIKPAIEEYFDGKVAVLDSTEVTARALEKILVENQLLKDSSSEEEDVFYVTDYTTSFENTTEIFYGKKQKLMPLSFW